MSGIVIEIVNDDWFVPKGRLQLMPIFYEQTPEWRIKFLTSAIVDLQYQYHQAICDLIAVNKTKQEDITYLSRSKWRNWFGRK